MAEGIARKYIGNITLYSAGIEAHALNPYAINAMKEIDFLNIHINSCSSKTVVYKGSCCLYGLLFLMRAVLIFDPVSKLRVLLIQVEDCI